MARPTPLSGFPEWLPGERVVEQHVLDELRRTFELHGFAGIETRAVEPLDQLLRKGETSKEVYVLRRLQETDDAPTRGHREAEKGLGLHFDLTVPFARYVLENAGHLAFPFRRYQIQKVWRGERPQDGRFREFVQADIDVVGSGELPYHYEVELPLVIADAFAALAGVGVPPVRILVNNRRVVEGFARGVGLADVDAVRDAEIVETELLLADLEILRKTLEKRRKEWQTNPKASTGDRERLEHYLELLKEGVPLRSVRPDRDALQEMKGLGLLTGKPILYVANVGEQELGKGSLPALADLARLGPGADEEAIVVPVSAKIEWELMQLEPDERLMRSIEEKIDITDARKDDFRREIMNFIGHLALEGKKFTYETNDRLRRALEMKLFEDQKDSIKLSSFVSNVIDKETQDKIDIIKNRLIKYFGYNEASATDVLAYVASIFARGDVKE